ncbi:type I polyketide synthase [Aspergillus melleus]|uniref:type I polyketide synthase n=1 Tax=Aspergillus melleus TaxID=138277 RepID=UPI001E8DE13A|nr:uncharacterized protein LDX57_011044 [Aspergillus melleus]KAH8433410.1 hypothetical protein LDX57_011044 [Aspergillus melleus]
MDTPEMTPARQREPIAIVGIGNVSSPSKLWELLDRNETGHCAVPAERYNAAAYHHPDADRPGSINSTGGYFIQEDLRSFENVFFGINDLEATSMDPQQRKLLEVTYEAFENAGVPLKRVYGSNTGVYVGNFTNDFMIMQYRDPEYFSRYSATGSGLAVLANRITHYFDLRGPSNVVDTSCSSSLYALHSACLALDAQDCDAAVVASANLIQSPEQQMAAVKAGILSPDSTCHTFDETANGYGRAEGVSAVYLKRLSDALRDGDPIRSVIKGTSVNGNGRTPGIVQPSVEGQKTVIRAAYRRAGLDLGETDYVEAHGTGTKVGDPIEIEAIAGVIRHRTGRPTLVGGIKPNVGHSEGASGLSSLIKVTLSLEKGMIPATIGINDINPSIKTNEWNVDIVTGNQLWPVSRVPRASINSFGFWGANGHAILEAAQERPLINGLNGSQEDINSDRLYLLPLSARSETSLAQIAKNLANYASHTTPQVAIEDLAFTLTCRRSKLAARGFLVESQRSIDKGLNSAAFRTSNSPRGVPFPLVFVYTGQGAQWAGMGKELLTHSSVFRKAIRYLDFCLRTLGPESAPAWTLEGALQTDKTSDINSAEMSQPLCTAVQVALTDVLKDMGALPEMVTGHSSGEIAAAYSAGAINLRQAILASFFRGAVVAESSAEGSAEGTMAAVGLGKEQVQMIIQASGLCEYVTVACANSPESTTISGDTLVVDRLMEIFQERSIWSRKLKTGGKAYHSHHMKVLGPKYQALLERYWEMPDRTVCNGSMEGQGSSVVTVSTVTGAPVSTSQVGRPEYWRTNLESPVRFDEAITFILGRGSYHLVELGPHSALQLAIMQNASTLQKNRYRYDTALIRHRDAWMTMLELVGSLFFYGHDDIQYQKTFADGSQPRVLVDLPPYPWDYSSPALWSEPRVVTEFRNRKYPRHELLGSQVPGGSTAVVTWRNLLGLNETEWLKHHCLGPSVVFPAAGYIAMAVEAMCQVAGLQLEDSPGVELRDLNFIKALDMDPERRPTIEIFTEMRPMKISNLVISDKWWTFSVVSVDNNSQSTLHMTAVVRLSETSSQINRQIQLDKSKMQQDAVRVWYSKFSQEGLNWGPQFAVLEEVFRDRERRAHEAAATTHLRREDVGSRYIAHPISIDAILQTAYVATTGGWIRKLRATVPVAMDSVYIAPPAALHMDTDRPWVIDTQSEQVGFGTVKVDAELFNSSGQVLVRMGQARCIAYQGNRQTDVTGPRNPLARAVWKPDFTALTNTGFDQYLNWFTQECGFRLADQGWLRLAGALDLACHQRCTSNILELSHQPGFSEVVRALLRTGTSFRRYNSYSRGIFCNGDLVETTDEQKPQTSSAIPEKRKFDIVLVPSADLWTPVLASRLTPGAIVIWRGDALSDEISWNRVVKGSGSFPVTVTTISDLSSQAKIDRTPTIVVTRDGSPTSLVLKLQKTLQGHLGSTVSIICLSQVSPETVPDRSIIISTLEQQQPLLSVADEHEIEHLKSITDRAAKILWVVKGGLLDGERPDFAPVRGLARTLMIEQPSLQFAVLDVDEKSASSPDTLQNIMTILGRVSHELEPDFEFVQRDGVLHISRWEPDDRLNEAFRLKQNEETIDFPLAAAGRCELGIKSPGQIDTIHFVQTEYETPLHVDYVEISVKSVGMNAKVSCLLECIAGFDNKRKRIYMR